MIILIKTSFIGYWYITLKKTSKKKYRGFEETQKPKRTFFSIKEKHILISITT